MPTSQGYCGDWMTRAVKVTLISLKVKKKNLKCLEQLLAHRKLSISARYYIIFISVPI